MKVIQWILLISHIHFLPAMAEDERKLDISDIIISVKFEHQRFDEVLGRLEKLTGVEFDCHERLKKHRISMHMSSVQLRFVCEFLATLVDSNFNRREDGVIVYGVGISGPNMWGDANSNQLRFHTGVRPFAIEDIRFSELYTLLVGMSESGDVNDQTLQFLRGSTKTVSAEFGFLEPDIYRTKELLHALFDGMPYLSNFHDRPNQLKCHGLWERVPVLDTAIHLDVLAQKLSEKAQLQIDIQSNWAGLVSLRGSENAGTTINDVLHDLEIFLDADRSMTLSGGVLMLPRLGGRGGAPNELYAYEVVNKEVVISGDARTTELQIFPKIEDFIVSVDAQSISEFIEQIKEAHDVPILENFQSDDEMGNAIKIQLDGYRLKNVVTILDSHPEYTADLSDGLLTIGRERKK